MDTPLSELTTGHFLRFLVGMFLGLWFFTEEKRHLNNWYWWVKTKQWRNR